VRAKYVLDAALAGDVICDAPVIGVDWLCLVICNKYVKVYNDSSRNALDLYEGESMNVIIVGTIIYLLFLFLEILEALEKRSFHRFYKGLMLFYWLSLILFVFRYIILAGIKEASINLNIIMLIIGFLNALLLKIYLYCRGSRLGWKYYSKFIRK